VRVLGAQGRVVAETPIIAGGRPYAAEGANVQDWWPHFPAVKGVIPVYHPDDPQFYGSLYHVRVPLESAEGRGRCEVVADAKSATTLVLFAASFECGAEDLSASGG
jgi:hypothetical protein